jgi:hypothetical protein
MKSTTVREEKEDLKTWRGRCVSNTVFVRGELCSVNSYLNIQTHGSIFDPIHLDLSNTFRLEHHNNIKVVIYFHPLFGLTFSSYLPYKKCLTLIKLNIFVEHESIFYFSKCFKLMTSPRTGILYGVENV